MTMQRLRRIFHKRRDVFISYRRKDGLWLARALYYYLKGKGVDCFFDFEDIHTGKFDEKIYGQIENSSYFVSVLTPCALEEEPNGGNWFRLELEHALQVKDAGKILPVHLRDCVCNLAFDTSERIRSGATINQHVLDEGDGFESSVDRVLLSCPEIRRKVKNADALSRLSRERKFRKKVLKLYRNEPDNARRSDKIRKIGGRYELPIEVVEEISEEICDQVVRERMRRAWMSRHPTLVFLFVVGSMALTVYLAMIAVPEFDAWARQQWGILAERAQALWQKIGV